MTTQTFRVVRVRSGHSPVARIDGADEDYREVRVGEQAIRLSPTEYLLLTEMIWRFGEVVPHTTLLQRIWGPAAEQNRHQLHLYIARLRRKLGALHDISIATEPGSGYTLRPG